MSSYTTIRIPKSLYELISNISIRERRAQWQVILSAMSLYCTIMKKPLKKTELDFVEKVSWYIFKFVKSLALFQENPTSENYNKLKKRLSEIRERVLTKIEGKEEIVNDLRNVVDSLEKLADTYYRGRSTNVKISMNDTAKLIIKLLILSVSEPQINQSST